MAKLKPVTFNNLPEIDENDGMVILYDGSRLGKSTKEIGQIIDNQMQSGLEEDTQYAMTTSGWERIYIPPTPVTADFRPGFAISFREGSGADTGKTFIDVTHTTRTLD